MRENREMMEDIVFLANRNERKLLLANRKEEKVARDWGNCVFSQ